DNLEKALSINNKSEKYELGAYGKEQEYKYSNINEETFHKRLENILKTQKKAFKVNIAIGYSTLNTRDNSIHSHHPNPFNTGISDKPFLVKDRSDIPKIMNMIRSKAAADTIKFDSSAQCDDAASMPECIKVDKNLMNPTATKNKCVFNCLAYHQNPKVDKRFLAAPVKNLCKQWFKFKGLDFNTQLFKTFKPIDILEFDQLEECFKINIDCYSLDIENDATKRIRESTKSFSDKIDILCHEGHAIYIKDVSKFIGSLSCPKCEMLFSNSRSRKDHMKNKCEQAELNHFQKSQLYINQRTI
ncbi:chromodomain protein, partial [Thraustotheca clavata]